MWGWSRPGVGGLLRTTLGQGVESRTQLRRSVYAEVYPQAQQKRRKRLQPLTLGAQPGATRLRQEFGAAGGCLPAALLTLDDLLTHWQGHRGLTRRVIEAFPEDQLLSFTAAPPMRPLRWSVRFIWSVP